MLDIGPASLKSLIFIELAWSNLTIRLAARSSLLGRRAIASLTGRPTGFPFSDALDGIDAYPNHHLVSLRSQGGNE